MNARPSMPVLRSVLRAQMPTPDPKLSPAQRQALLRQVRRPFLEAQAQLLRRRVERIVVLMLENRSFDHILGWLGPENGGLRGTESNPPAPNTGSRKAVSVYPISDTLLPISPPHAGGATPEQINAGAMDGFVSVFHKYRESEIAVVEPIEGHPPESLPMAYYREEALPSYRHLVQHHTVCTRYHASVPAGTWPNRMYFYAGTSNNLFRNGHAVLRNDDADAAYDAQMPKRLLVDLLDEKGVDWCIYAHTIAWMRLFPGRFDRPSDRTRSYRKFEDDCREGKLPAVVFIDPNWVDLGRDERANDDQAPSDLLAGQRLVARTYNALRALPGKSWEKTMFVVTYDEHGGFHDHVRPPGPLGWNAEETADRFATLGVRVPTFVVSAYAQAALSDTLFDHASLHATIHRTFLPDVGLLSGRAEVADTFGVLLTLDEPRALPPAMDVPEVPEPTKRDRQELDAVARAERHDAMERRVAGRLDTRETRREDRHDSQEERIAGRNDNRVERVEARHDRREDRQGDRHDRREERVEDRHDRQENRQDDRQDRRADVQEDRVERRLEPRLPSPDDEDGGFRAWVASFGARRD
jgi:phospholipase C